MNSATIIVETDKGCQASYIHRYFDTPPSQEILNHHYNSPNLGYRFDFQFNHFFFYKDSFSYGGFGKSTYSEVVGIEEGNFGERKAKEKCLELLLNDRDILHKAVFIKADGSSELKEVAQPHVGWTE